MRLVRCRLRENESMASATTLRRWHTRLPTASAKADVEVGQGVRPWRVRSSDEDGTRRTQMHTCPRLTARVTHYSGAVDRGSSGASGRTQCACTATTETQVQGATTMTVEDALRRARRAFA